MKTIIFLIIYLAPTFVALWKLFEQQGKKGWHALIPFYNMWIWIKIMEKREWWFILFFIPYINIFMFWLLLVDWTLGYQRHKIWEYIGATVFPFIYFPWLVFIKKETYAPPSKLPKYVKSKGREWFDSIVFAVVAAMIVRTFYFESYTIPSSSMEKSMLVGDYLFVSKMHYGPKLPVTPLAVPFTHHTLPVFGGKAYSELIKLPYRRMWGWADVKRNDPIVFHYPDGDTLSTLYQSNVSYYAMVRELGRDAVWNEPYKFGKIIARPVDKRENFVKRCIAIAGDTLQIIDRQVYINGKKAENPRLYQFNYTIEKPLMIAKSQWRELGVSVEDIQALHQTGSIPMTPEVAEKIARIPNVGKVTPVNHPAGMYDPYIFPFDERYPWNVDNFGPLYIPQKGKTVMLDTNNLMLYARIIKNYEGNELTVKDGHIFINGKEANSYTFKMNYYWMMGDNRHNSADSRYWGFVPEDHIVGKPSFVWLSLDKDESFPKKIRWGKMFRIVR